MSSIPAGSVLSARGPAKAKAFPALVVSGSKCMSIAPKVNVYVDGFNLYYRGLKNTPYKWLNLETLARRLLQPGDTIEMIRYFTARVKPLPGKPDAPRDQQVYLSALATLPNLSIHFGRFLSNTKMRPLASDPSQYVKIRNSEEKGSDVNLAVHLLNDAWRGAFDVALVISQDTDLVEPMRMVRDELHKPVGLVWADGGQPNKHLRNVASFVRHIETADFAASQFPDSIQRPGGTPIFRPPGW